MLGFLFFYYFHLPATFNYLSSHYHVGKYADLLDMCLSFDLSHNSPPPQPLSQISRTPIIIMKGLRGESLYFLDTETDFLKKTEKVKPKFTFLERKKKHSKGVRDFIRNMQRLRK